MEKIHPNLQKKEKYLLEDIKKLVHEKDVRQTLDHIYQCDPVCQETNGKKSPFVNKILEWFNNKTVILPEDISDVNSILKKYNSCKQLENMPPIDSFNTIGDVMKYISEKYGNDIDEISAYSFLSCIKKIGNYSLYEVNTWEEAKVAFADSGWCVKTQSTYESYASNGNFILVVKGNKRFALCQPCSYQIKNVYDNSVSESDLSDNDIKSIIKFIWPKFRYQGDLQNFDSLYDNILEDIQDDDPSMEIYVNRNITERDIDFENNVLLKNKLPCAAYAYCGKLFNGNWPD